MTKVIFSFDGIQTSIQCLKEESMKNICNKFSTKIGIDVYSLLFIYGGSQINFELSFQQQANLIDKARNEMNILVYKQDRQNENKLKCPKCGEEITLDIFDDLIKFNSNQKVMLNELKGLIDIMNNSNEIYQIKNKIKLINLVINNLIEENEKNTKNIHSFINTSYNKIKSSIKKINNINSTKHNIIKGVFNVEDTYKDVTIFNQYVEDEGGFDLYLNNKKINIIKSYNISCIYFDYEGNYEYKIIFKNNISNLENAFKFCSRLIALDFSEFEAINATSMKGMFNGCQKLREIKGINKLNTSLVNDMLGMFQNCNEIEYLDLSNFDTSKVTNMGYMFNKCYNLKEIKGINLFNTSNVNIMTSMFSDCHKMEYLDLSNFNTINVNEMSYMFFGCNKLKSLNLLNFKVKNNCKTEEMFYFDSKEQCNFITKSTILKNIYN